MIDEVTEPWTASPAEMSNFLILLLLSVNTYSDASLVDATSLSPGETNTIESAPVLRFTECRRDVAPNAGIE